MTRWISVVALVAFAACRSASAQTSYLAKNDRIVCVGDSITAAGLALEFVEQILRTLYPDAGITLHNLGQGGASAPAGAASLAGYLDKHDPTLATFMFGVNDTRWSEREVEEKIRAFLGGLQAAVAGTAAKKVPLVLLRESHFSHGANAPPDAFESKVNRTLLELLAAQDDFAAANHVPVVDVLGAYQRQLAAAWAKDPAYEFSPDVIHPTSPGHAAIALEILRAFGVGLPLAVTAGERGPLHLAPASALSLRVADSRGVIDPDGALAVKVEVANAGKEPVEGTLVACAAGEKLERRVAVAAGGTAEGVFELPVARLAGRWNALPLYVAFIGPGTFAADGTLLFYSHVRAIAREPLVVADGEFTTAAAGKARRCPVSGVRLSREQGSLCVDFTWKDDTPVAARPGFRNRFRQQIDKPVDLRSREAQPCDAIEFFFDLRDEEAIGRWTSHADDNPAGILRLGVFREQVEAGPAANVLAAEAGPPATIRLESTGADAWRLTVGAKPAGPIAGFSMRVTDSEDVGGPRTEPFYLTFRQGQEPMSYVLFGDSAAGVFCRIGY
jgi:lysophospholipase L1-like esterase